MTATPGPVPGPGRRPARVFTLVDVLLTTVLLAFLIGTAVFLLLP